MLFHYTCAHGRQRIGRRGYLLPGLDGFLWMTDLDVPVREALGLTSKLLDCDRTQFRYAASVDEGGGVIPYLDYRHLLDPVRREGIEAAPGVLIRHWFVAARPVYAVLT
jgi:hypothetical protein